VDVTDGVAYISYKSGPGGECEMCEISSDDLEDLIAERMRTAAPHIREVRVASDLIGVRKCKASVASPRMWHQNCSAVGSSDSRSRRFPPFQ